MRALRRISRKGLMAVTVRFIPFALVFGAASALAGCSDEAADTAEEPAVQASTETPSDAAASAPDPAAQDAAAAGDEEAGPAQDVVAATDGATPMAERVATIGLLNKRNNVSVDLEMSPGETREEGPVSITLAACERTAPWEMPQETGAFVQVDVLERGQQERTRAFSGWLFKRSPSLNVVEHPIYDVWVKDCAMRFPGDEASSD